MPLVRRTNYRQKKQDIHQLKNQNQQLQDQISQLQALQKENPTQARHQTIKNLSKKQGNIYSHLNGLGAGIKDDMERERERATSPISLEFSTEREIPEQNRSSMPDNSELDSPTAVVGDEEVFPNNSKLTALLTERNEQLDHAEDFIKTLQAGYDALHQEYSDYRFKGEYEINRCRHLLACLEIEQEEHRQQIINLVSELDYAENSSRTLQITFDRVCRQRDDA